MQRILDAMTGAPAFVRSGRTPVKRLHYPLIGDLLASSAATLDEADRARAIERA